MSNMELWNSVCETDPNHTKHVKQRGGYTSIDAHYQIQEATRAFGPVGIGWGYEVVNREVVAPFIICDVVLWHGSRENSFGPMPGCAEILGNRPDSDAPKKAVTDAITKLLSHLGFNADVFLGKFDDSKYVQERRQEVAKDKAPPFNFNARATADRIKGRIDKCRTQQDVDDAWADEAAKPAGGTRSPLGMLKDASEPMFLEVQKHKEDAKARLMSDPAMQAPPPEQNGAHYQ